MSQDALVSIGEHFRRQLAIQPQRTALLVSTAEGLRAFSWSDVADRAARILQLADQAGLRPGDHVASWLPNSLEWIAVDLAAQWGGLVHVALDARLPAASAAALSEHMQARLVFATQPGAALLVGGARSPSEPHGQAPTGDLFGDLFSSASGCRAVGLDRLWEQPAMGDLRETLRGRPRPQSGQLAQILTTSGTISQPKGVMLSHGNLLTNALAKLDAAPQVAEDVRLNILPFAHAYARTCELSTWIISGSQLCIARDWQDVLELAGSVRPTLINLVPHLAHKLVDALDQAAAQAPGIDAGRHVLGDRLRLLQVGGAALPAATWQRLAAAGWPPLQGYGLTETSPVICSNRAGQQRPETVGPPVAGVEVKRDDQGVLWTRGPHVMLGYWRAQAETDAKIRGGWLCTGDVAELAEDGHWRIVGRSDDQITLSTGYKASPHEVTRRVAHDPWIDQVVVVGQNRPHLAALVYPRLSELPEWLFDPVPDTALAPPVTSSTPTLATAAAEAEGLVRGGAMFNEARFARALAERWQAAQSDLPRQLRIEKIAVLRQPLTSDDGGLNFKGAIRRKFVEEQLLAEAVDRLYAD
ncbi:MAG: AMP-binding protein [Aureliella sp.]